MELHKIEDVDFSINRGNVTDDINLVWKEGQLYLSLKNVMLTDGKKWYDIPIRELENVRVISENPTKLSFQLPSLEVIVTGKYAERLLAFRHFLLPYVLPKRNEMMKDRLKGLVKFHSMGVIDLKALASVLELTTEEIRKLMKLAREEGYIAQGGKITEKAYKMFSSKERDLLQSLEGRDG